MVKSYSAAKKGRVNDHEKYIMERFNNPLFSIHQLPKECLGSQNLKKLHKLCEQYDKRYYVLYLFIKDNMCI